MHDAVLDWLNVIGGKPAPLHVLTSMIEDIWVTPRPTEAEVRRWNWYIVDEVNKTIPIKDSVFLDAGAAIAGYALEAALNKGVKVYEGVSLSEEFWRSRLIEFEGPNNSVGRIRHMDAARLEFDDNTFDCALSFNTFEHFSEPQKVLSEVHRVLKPGGSLIISFFAIWSSPIGYHLLQHGNAVDRLVPPWGHLFLSEAQMREVLAKDWPNDAPLTVDAATDWIYRSDELNRLDVRQLTKFFETSPLSLEWLLPIRDEREELRTFAQYVSRLVPFSESELLTNGFSAHFKKR